MCTEYSVKEDIFLVKLSIGTHPKVPSIYRILLPSQNKNFLGPNLLYYREVWGFFNQADTNSFNCFNWVTLLAN